MKHLVRILTKLIIVLAVIFFTTFGWRPSPVRQIPLTETQIQTRNNLKNTVSVLVNDIGVRNYRYYSSLEEAAKYIAQSFEKMGYKVEFQEYEAVGKKFRNIIAFLPGSAGKPFILVGAHYDSCFNPGADDNASGVAGVLELARLLKNARLPTPVKFAAFVNEEPPFLHSELMGSRQYASRLIANGEQLKVAVILEMVGYYSDKTFSQRYLPLLGPFYPNQGNFIALIANFRSQKYADELAGYFRASSSFPLAKLIAPDSVPRVNFSDHWSFWKEGYPAMMVTDTAYLRNPHYHRSSDLPLTLNYEKLTAVIEGLKAAILKLSQEP